MKRIPTDLHARARALAPGVLACAVVAAAAAFLSGHYGAPVMLFALLLGLAMNFLATDGPCAAGIEFTARTVLRVGIALLGLRITFGQVQAMGWQPVALVVGSMALTIGLSMAVARLMGFQAIFGLLTGGATAICGASAALALSAALPVHPLKERATLFTVIGVSALSTLAMIVYPMIVKAAGLDASQAGVFLGATIHDVAQVVGAGYSLSRELREKHEQELIGQAVQAWRRRAAEIARQFGYALRQGTGGALDLGPDVGEAVVAVETVACVLQRMQRGGRHHQHGYARGDHQRDCQRLPAHVPQVAQRLAVDGFQAHHQCSSRAGRRSALTCSRPMRPSAM